MTVTVHHQAEKCRGLLLQHMCLAGVLLFVRYLVVGGNLAKAAVAQHPLPNRGVPPLRNPEERGSKRKAFTPPVSSTSKLSYAHWLPAFFSPWEVKIG